MSFIIYFLLNFRVILHWLSHSVAELTSLGPSIIWLLPYPLVSSSFFFFFLPVVAYSIFGIIPEV